jgi:GntR family transcriptional regulator, transcriptional repressor for pyruvate dehydrogenase complex
MVDTDRKTLSFTKVERDLGLADRVANQLLDRIVSQQFHPGDRLPPEREIGEALGVSRSVVREAIRILNGKGVLSVKSGSGVVVTAVDRQNVVETMKLFIHAQGGLHPGGSFSYDEIHEVREMVEVRVTGLAAQRATEQDLVELRQAFREMDENVGSPETLSDKDVEFHRTIARSAHNELYLIMLDSIGDVLLEIRLEALSHKERRTEVLAHHQRILDAILSHDSEAARRAMAEHLEDSASFWRSQREQNVLVAGRPRGRGKLASTSS